MENGIAEGQSFQRYTSFPQVNVTEFNLICHSVPIQDCAALQPTSSQMGQSPAGSTFRPVSTGIRPEPSAKKGPEQGCRRFQMKEKTKISLAERLRNFAFNIQ